MAKLKKSTKKRFLEKKVSLKLSKGIKNVLCGGSGIQKTLESEQTKPDEQQEFCKSLAVRTLKDMIIPIKERLASQQVLLNEKTASILRYNKAMYEPLER